MTKSERFGIVAGLLCGVLLLTLMFWAVTNPFGLLKFLAQVLFSPTSWTVERIENALGAKLPEDAIELEYEGFRYHGEYLRLSFKASPESLAPFLADICGGELHQQYNPFDAIDDDDVIENSAAIRVYLPDPHMPFTYYSYSAEATEFDYGNRCINENMFETDIYVDTLNRNQFAVEVMFSQARHVRRD